MKNLLNKIAIILISFVSLSIILLPFSTVFTVPNESADGQWQPLYLIQDPTSLLFYLPFVALWFVYLLVKRRLTSNVFKIILGALALVTFIVSFLSVSFIAQDYEPNVGLFLSVFIFPLFILYFITDQRIKQTGKRE